MRWSRRDQNESSLGELMEGSPDTPQGTAVAVAPDEGADDPLETTEGDGDFLDNEDYLPQERQGLSRLTVALVAALVLAVGVFGGIWVQKQLGTTSGGRSVTAGQGAVGAGAGAGAGAAGTGQRRNADAGAGAGSDTGGSTGGTGTAATPAVVGTVTSAGAKSLVVTDLGGTTHTVTVTSTTTVTTPYGHGALAKGDTVAVAGTDTDGSVNATAVTVS